MKIHISSPQGTFKKSTVEMIQLPARDGVITILEERAPSVFALDLGFINILDEGFQVKERYCISSGFADYANGFCKVIVENIVNYQLVDNDKLKLGLELSDNESSKEFYEFMIDEKNKE